MGLKNSWELYAGKHPTQGRVLGGGVDVLALRVRVDGLEHRVGAFRHLEGSLDSQSRHPVSEHSQSTQSVKRQSVKTVSQDISRQQRQSRQPADRGIRGVSGTLLPRNPTHLLLSKGLSLYLTQNVSKVVLQKSTPPQIRRPILSYY